MTSPAPLLAPICARGHVTILDPDDTMGMPAYDGPVEQAASVLTRGLYPATFTTDASAEPRPATVVITADGSYVAEAMDEDAAKTWAALTEQEHVDEAYGSLDAALTTYQGAGTDPDAFFTTDVIIGLEYAEAGDSADAGEVPDRWRIGTCEVSVEDHGIVRFDCRISAPTAEQGVTITTCTSVKTLHRSVEHLSGYAYVIAYAQEIGKAGRALERRAHHVARALAAYDAA